MAAEFANDSPTLEACTALGYAALSVGAASTAERFVLLRESGPIKVGKLRKESTEGVLDFKSRLTWNSHIRLYGFGLVTPCLHLGKDEEPYWTLLLTVLMATSTQARQKLERLRHTLSQLPRSMAHEVVRPYDPFHPTGVTIAYEAGSALIANTKVGLPPDNTGEASTWAEKYPLSSRLFLRELALVEELAISETGSPTKRLCISKKL